ncbi:SDR family oxidoreductase [Psychrobacillus sp. INOP01]|uniref:SDR family oxidoreductase n=1 Tax=Psychrobacillus sp. INOP01 TaxID=2829187 RepID=UPI001BAB228F|nr:SDR family oxidoreductase [Psychrobacillus sp. INOP01]QUG41857.1 SDR family oxidoreductase [Psychrobacillus sp. INOP01]
MKVVVIGANGQIGQHVVKELQKNDNHSVKAMVRKEEQAETLKMNRIQSVIADLEGSVDDLAKAITGAEAVIFIAGSGGHTGPDKTLLIDLDGAVKTMEAAKQVGVNRYIMVSAYDADKRQNWNEAMRPYYVAKHYADRMLETSGLNYTIVRPGGLVNEPSTEKIAVGAEAKPSTITREDVAHTIIATLENEKTYHRAFNLVNGTQSIEVALNSL